MYLRIIHAKYEKDLIKISIDPLAYSFFMIIVSF